MSTDAQFSTERHVESDPANDSDRISQLSDSLLSCILSRLPTADAVRTSVLSKEWEQKWYTISSFQFDDRLFNEGANFLEFLERTLPQLQSIVRFNLVCHRTSTYNSSRIGACIAQLVGKAVQYLGFHNYGEMIFLPPSLLSCTSLRELELHRGMIFIVPIQDRFFNLTRLCLTEVWFHNENSSTDELFLTCPVLETFHMTRCHWINVLFIEVHAPKLKYFMSTTPRNDQDVGSRSIRIHGAKLEHFCVSGGYLETFDLLASTVESAILGNNPDDNAIEVFIECGFGVRKLLKTLSGIKKLIFLGNLTQAIGMTNDILPYPVYHTLENLELYSHIDVQGLLVLLHASPYLKCLRLDILNSEHAFDDYNYDVDVPSCIVSHLKVVQFFSFQSSEAEYNLIKFLVKNGAVLKELLLLYLPGKAEEDDIKKKVSTFSRASSCLKINLWGM